MKKVFPIRFLVVLFALWCFFSPVASVISSESSSETPDHPDLAFEGILEQLGQGDDARQRIEAASRLRDQGVQILPFVRGQLASERNPLRLKILMGWVALHEQFEACPELLSLLESNVPEVAVAAALCAGKLGCPGAMELFRDVAEQTTRPLDIRSGMARSLGFLGKSSAEETRDWIAPEKVERALIRILRLPIPALQTEAVGSLVFMNARNAEEALGELERSFVPYVSYYARRACHKLFPAGPKETGAGGAPVSGHDFRFSLPFEEGFDRKVPGSVSRETGDPLERASAAWSGDRSELIEMWESFHGTVPQRSLPRYYLVLPDRDRLPLVEDWLEEPLDMPNKAGALCRKFQDFFPPGASRVPAFSGDFVRACRAVIFPGTKADPTDFPRQSPSRPAPTLADLLFEVLHSPANKTLSRPDSLKELDRLLPGVLSVNLGELLASIIRLHEAWEFALRPLPEKDRIRLKKTCLDRAGAEDLPASLLNRASRTIAGLRLDAVWEAEDLLLETLARTAGVLGTYRGWSPEGRANWAWRTDTPYGAVALYGNADHRILHRGCLVVDFGGNDEWVHEEPNNGNGPGVRVCIDLAGNDSYRSTETPGFGGAVMGLGLVLDLEGDDRYVCDGIGLGAAVLGTGFLLDGSGDDFYSGRRFCQGAAAYGTGILADLSGRDRFRAGSRSQGYGETRGIGVLVERSGNDSYSLGADEPGDAKDTAPGLSLGQGCGMGFRSDSGDSLSGGVGLLFDLEGEDVYVAKTLAQGTGYWFAIGALVDLRGGDSYTVDNYGQGAGIHAGVGVLLDASGADRYLGRHHAAGCGLDRGGGILFDVAGNDEYLNESDVQGAGVKPLGFGVLVDHEGNDRYRARVGRGYCRLPAFWPSLWATGLFYDRSGTDSYEGDVGMGGNRRIWTQNRYGFGVDAQ